MPLLYALTPNLSRLAKSVAVKRDSALMKSSGTLGDAELQEAVAQVEKKTVSPYSQRVTSEQWAKFREQREKHMAEGRRPPNNFFF